MKLLGLKRRQYEQLVSQHSSLRKNSKETTSFFILKYIYDSLMTPARNLKGSETTFAQSILICHAVCIKSTGVYMTLFHSA